MQAYSYYKRRHLNILERIVVLIKREAAPLAYCDQWKTTAVVLVTHTTTGIY